MIASTVTIVDTGVANLRSLQECFRRLGQTTRLSVSAEEIEAASHLVLPGVGSFGVAMARLDEGGLREALVKRIEQDRPTLAICLGFQLLCRRSEEAPEANGLGIIPADISRFSDLVPVPHLGWNDVAAWGDDRFPSGHAYFANSFRLNSTEIAGWRSAISEYDGPFISALSRGSILACQFHPELSGAWGTHWIACWLKGESC